MKLTSLFKTTLFFIVLFRITFADTIPPVTPVNITGNGYLRHLDLDWFPNTEPDLAGYKIYRYTNNQFNYFTTVSKEKSYFTLWIGGPGYSTALKISAIDVSGNESPLSDSIGLTTKEMTDYEYLDMVQRATFRYFYDFGHPVSGLARERNSSGDLVTSGGSGFGIMAIVVGTHRNYISRSLAAERMYKITNFLLNKADKFHGAFPHWFNGVTGRTIAFSQYDDGGDLVETAFLIQGLLAARSYFNGSDTTETKVREMITQIWEGVEWSWYLRSPFSNHLYWHWSPNYGWQMNFKLEGWNETMITYLLAYGSPTYGIPKRTWASGWAGNNYLNGNTYYGHKLFLGSPYGGPLFFAHYSFLGFDPRNKKDAFANYFNQNRNHTLINRGYCIANPYSHPGYSENIWGLTACDNPFGYGAHAPYSNDNGTIAPTAGISSMPYTPDESINLLKSLYQNYGNSVWGDYGFYDAFNIRQNWFANSYLAIDQGPIIVMIENYRSGLIWQNFMSNSEVNSMLDSAGFVEDITSVNDTENSNNFGINYGNYPNPFNPETKIVFNSTERQSIRILIYNINGTVTKILFEGEIEPGLNSFNWNAENDQDANVSSGVYFYSIFHKNGVSTGKMLLIR